MKIIKEYAIDENGAFDQNILATEPMTKEAYTLAHKSLPIVTHDVLIKYKEGFLLLKRDNKPVKGMLFPVGGRIKRGIQIEKSLQQKVKEECGLEIKNVQFIGIARELFRTEPFGHGKGTDTISLMFVAIGSGTILLDNLHSEYLIVDKEKYAKIKKTLHPWVRDFLEKAFEHEKSIT